MVEEVKNVGHYRPFCRPSFSSVESLRDREEERLGWKTRYRVGCNWRSYQVFHSCLVVYFARKTKMQMLNHSIILNCLRTLLHLRVPPAPMGDWGYRGAQQPGWPTEGPGGEWPRPSEHLPASFSRLFLHHLGTRLTQGHRKGGSFSVFLLFVCRPLFWRATVLPLQIWVILTIINRR